jgi:hypothetical protein
LHTYYVGEPGVWVHDGKDAGPTLQAD